MLYLLAVVTKMPGLPNGFKMVPTYSVRKNGCGSCGVSFLTCPIKIISPKNFLISSGVILDHFSVLGDFPFFSILTMVKVRLFSK
jgi:hypothetical protein